MDKLTLFTSIRGPSIDDVKAKASWAEEYGRNLYNNDVEITNEVRHTFDKAYREQFEGQDE